MRNTRNTLFTMLLVLAALPSFPAVAQQPEPASVRRARAGLPPVQAKAFDEILTNARARGLPIGPIVDKALEGAAKGVRPDVVIVVLRERANRLALAKVIVGERGQAEVVNMLMAFDRGVDEKLARRVVAGARQQEPVGMALNILADLVQRGVPLNDALEVLTSWRLRGGRSSDLQELPAAIERLMREGDRP